MQIAYRQCGESFWSSDTAGNIEKDMFQAFVSGGGLAGLLPFVLEDRHRDAVDRTMAIRLRRMAGGRMSWTQEDGSTICYSNGEVFKWWRIPRCATALRIRRLRWYLAWARRPEDFGSAIAAVSGASKLD